MDPLESHVNINDVDHRENRSCMDAILSDFRQAVATVKLGGGEAAVSKHKSRGKMLARERIERLIDEGSPFLEFSSLAANGMYEEGARAPES